ncbi:MAG: 4-hydroxy-tetrahydrodipicolinate synthase [Tardiphaga sp.]
MSVAKQASDWLGGIIADVPTPFTERGEIDHATFARLCERQACAGADAILICDIAGEAATLTLSERTALIRTAVAIARGRIRVIVGAGSNATRHAIAWTQLAEAAGADAVMSVVPYYNRPTQDGIAAHFHAIASATRLPIVLHDAPARCARALSDDTLLRLADLPRMIGLCSDDGVASRVVRLRQRLPAGFRLLSGDDTAGLSYLLVGGDGVVSATANVAPQLCRGMVVACRQGQTRYAATIMRMLTPLAAALAPDMVAPAVKYALSLRGLARPCVRLPLVELGDAEQRAVADALEEIWATPELPALRWQRGWRRS